MSKEHDDNEDGRPHFPYPPMGYPPMMRSPSSKPKPSSGGGPLTQLVLVIFVAAGFMSGKIEGYIAAAVFIIILSRM